MTSGTKQDPWVLATTPGTVEAWGTEVTHHPRNNSMRAIRS
jgi:hypothetical protein